jgi:hypothetical protein
MPRRCWSISCLKSVASEVLVRAWHCRRLVLNVDEPKGCGEARCAATRGDCSKPGQQHGCSPALRKASVKSSP